MTGVNDTYFSSRIVHRLAVLIVCLIWPLIWVGGLVTTYDAGMAVPDWPNTYGYNLFLYPYKTWLLGPFDLFIEHGHRLLGALVGFTAIGLVIAAFRKESRKWVRWFSVFILGAVIVQGGLGGIRVVLGDRTFAMIHGCTAPVVFSIATAAVVVTSRWWMRKPALEVIPRFTLEIVVALVAVCYMQLVLGAQLRHLQPGGSPQGFTHNVALHVISAFVLWGLTAVAWIRLRGCGDLTLSRPGLALVGLTFLQILLGLGTWVANYNWPAFLQFFPGAESYVIESKSYTSGLIVTSHVATGSLILAVGAFLLVRLLRVRRQVANTDPATRGDNFLAQSNDADA